MFSECAAVAISCKNQNCPESRDLVQMATKKGVLSIKVYVCEILSQTFVCSRRRSSTFSGQFHNHFPREHLTLSQSAFKTAHFLYNALIMPSRGWKDHKAKFTFTISSEVKIINSSIVPALDATPAYCNTFMLPNRGSFQKFYINFFMRFSTKFASLYIWKGHVESYNQCPWHKYCTNTLVDET